MKGFWLAGVLAGCGGGGTYTVTTSAGANGSISPVAATVGEGDTMPFTITPDINSLDGGFGIGGGKLVVTDGNNNRALIWNSSVDSSGNILISGETDGNAFIAGETLLAGLDGNTLIGTGDGIIVKYALNGTKQ